MSSYELDVIAPRETELEPSPPDSRWEPSEFPILYKLLTETKTSRGNVDSIYRSTSSILSYSSITTKRQNETQYEADSSAYTDEEEDGISSNTSSGSSSCDFGSSEEDCDTSEGHHHHQQHHRRRHPIKKSKPHPHQITTKQMHHPVNLKQHNEEDDDIYPTSTTTTFDIGREEEIEDESHIKDRRKENYRITNLKRTHDNIILTNSINNSSSNDNDSCSSTSSDSNKDNDDNDSCQNTQEIFESNYNSSSRSSKQKRLQS